MNPRDLLCTPRCTWWGYAWASPITVVGLVLGAAGGMRWQRVQGVLEGYGGWLGRVLHRVFRIDAITLGHVVLGFDALRLAHWRDHERAHVRQYERYGPFMPLLYWGCSAWALARGKRIYFDNALEVQARAADAAHAAMAARRASEHKTTQV
jgi:hypothetical protein